MNAPIAISNPKAVFYADIMEEIKLRLFSIEAVLLNKNQWVPRIMEEFCFLQIRLICELIALGCLVAHGDITNKKVLKNWNTAQIMKTLEKLKPNFFPKAVSLVISPTNVHCDEKKTAHLSKSDLIAIWQRSGDKLHRGSALKLLNEKKEQYKVNEKLILEYVEKIARLLEQHIISSSDNKTHFIVGLKSEDHNGQCVVATAKSP